MLHNIINEFYSTDILLKHIHIDSQIYGFAARVSIEQIFCNINIENIEVIYHFPIEGNTTIYSFLACFDNEREIHIELKEKNQVKNEPSQIYTEYEQTKNMFKINLGILKSGSQCHIKINYITELDLVTRNILRLIIPNFYTKNNQLNYGKQMTYTSNFNCEIINNRMTLVSCLSYHNAIIEDRRINESKIYVKFSNIPIEQDIIIDVFINCENCFDSVTAVESSAIMTGFISYNPFDEKDRYENHHEFIFLVDCSETMKNNDSIELARKVLLKFLEILPVNCRFNIIRFGSNFHFLFDRTITDEYSTMNSKKAKKFIQNIKADLNGMNLIELLKWLYNNPPKLNKSRQILLLIGSEIFNIEEMVNLCRKMATHSRIFTVGLGLLSNRVLVKELARVTNGKSILIPPNAQVEYYIADQLQRILHQTYNDINIRWTYLSENNPIQLTLPIHPPNVLFAETCFRVYALLNETQPLEREIKIELIENKQQQESCLATVCINHIPDIGHEWEKIIARVTAKALIDSENENNDEEQQRKLMLDISLKYGILCPLTTFVGIERHLNNNEISIPNQQ